MSASTNPLLRDTFRIPFHEIRAEHVTPGIQAALEEAQAQVDAVARTEEPPTWANTLAPLDEATERLARRITPARHLVSVAETPELRDAYNEVLPEISAFWSRLPLDPALWARVKAFADTDEAAALEGVRARHLEKTLEEFRRAGADLPEESKDRLKELRVELASLQQKFSENVLDATAAYELLISDESRLEGVPEAPKRRYRARAAESDQKGWLLTLDYPSVEPILKYAKDRSLREEIHSAYVGRCRDGELDNRSVIARVLRLRDELAEILGYDNFPDFKLQDRMAGTGARAMDFEEDLTRRTRPYWDRDKRELEAHARALGLDRLRPWDVAFVREKLRKERYDVDDEQLRPYFPLDQVLAGLFEVVRRTFGFRVEEVEIEEVWHEDVRYYELFDESDDTRVGAFYTDWFPRREKRQGAWMNDFITGGPREDGGFDPHLGTICGNFTPPDGDAPALLTHREVQTTFHEFGHLLHHCTSRVEVPGRAGINVAWDWVELPSQLMENWTWEREALDVFARHHETGEPFPEELFQRLVAARRFMGGWHQMRQLSFGTLDLTLHHELAHRLRTTGNGESGGTAAEESPETDERDLRQGREVMEVAGDVLEDFSPAPEFARSHILTSFTHLFAGGYAAGYYSYLWSEVLDADVFTRFRDEGIFNRETGRAYVDAILSRGDAEDPETLFRRFMGRDPDPEALLERNLGELPV